MKAHYHRCCYNELTIINYRQDELAPSNDQLTYYKTLEIEAFKEVVSFCYQLSLKPRLIKFTFVVDIMRRCIERQGE